MSQVFPIMLSVSPSVVAEAPNCPQNSPSGSQLPLAGTSCSSLTHVWFYLTQHSSSKQHPHPFPHPLNGIIDPSTGPDSLSVLPEAPSVPQYGPTLSRVPQHGPRCSQLALEVPSFSQLASAWFQLIPAWSQLTLVYFQLTPIDPGRVPIKTSAV